MKNVATTSQKLRLSTAEFADFLANVKGNPIASITMVTPQKSKLSAYGKKAIDQDKIFKLSVMQGQLGSTYAKRVNNQLIKEGKEADFTPQLGNVARVSGCLGRGALDWNGHLFYMIFTPNRNSKGESYYIYDGKKVDHSFVEQIFVPSAFKRYQSKSQGTDNNILHFTPLITNIIEVVVNGQTVTHVR